MIKGCVWYLWKVPVVSIQANKSSVKKTQGTFANFHKKSSFTRKKVKVKVLNTFTIVSTLQKRFCNKKSLFYFFPNFEIFLCIWSDNFFSVWRFWGKNPSYNTLSKIPQIKLAKEFWAAPNYFHFILLLRWPCARNSNFTKVSKNY